MKLIKRIMCAFTLAFATILLAGCSAKKEDVVDVAKKASEAMDNAKSYQMSVSAKLVDEGDNSELKAKASFKINIDGTFEYTVKYSGKMEGKDTNFKEEGTLVKDGEKYVFYVSCDSKIGDTEEKYNNKYTLLTSTEAYAYMDDTASMFMLMGGMASLYLEVAEEFEEVDEENNKLTASSFLGTYKISAYEKDGDDESDAVIKYNKNGIKSISVKTKSGSETFDYKISFKYKDKEISIKAPSGSYDEK